MHSSTRRTPPAPRPHQPTFILLAGAVLAACLSACGGGSDGSPSASSSSGGQGRLTAQTIPVSSNVVTGDQGDGWAAAPPAQTLLGATQPLVSDEALASRRRIYVESLNVSAVPQIPADQRDGSIDKPFLTFATFKTKTTLQNNDVIALKCGSVWRDQLVLDLTGRTGIRIGVYADKNHEECADDQLPAIRGSKWLNTAGWQLQAASQDRWNRAGIYTLAYTEAPARLFKDLIPQTKARYPNDEPGKQFSKARAIPRLNGELDADYDARAKKQFFISESDLAKFKDLGLTSADLVDATVYVRTEAFLIEPAQVTAYDASTGLVTINKVNGKSAGFLYKVQKDAGYMFEGKNWMLDKAGEWCAGKVEDATVLYSYGSGPTGVEVSPASTFTAEWNTGFYGIQVSNANDLTIERIRLELQSYAGIEIKNSKNVRIRGVESVYSKEIGLAVGGTSSDVEIVGSRVLGAGSYGILTGEATSPTDATRSKVNDNYVADTGRYLTGEPLSYSIDKRAGIRLGGNESQARGNYILRSSGTGLFFNNTAKMLVENNTVLQSCLRWADCGGIYARRLDPKPAQGQTLAQAWTSFWAAIVAQPVVADRAKVTGNFVAGNKSNSDGCRTHSEASSTNICTQPGAFGIYLDDYTGNVEVSGNAVAGTEVGIYIHNAAWNDVHDNKVRGAKNISFLANYDAKDYEKKDPPYDIMRGNHVWKNSFISRRGVDLSSFTDSATGSPNPGYIGMKASQHTYAQLWLHKTDARAFFADGGGRPRNTVDNNETLSLSKVDDKPIWRMAATGQLAEQGRGGIWALKAATSSVTEELALSGWQTASASNDTEKSPVSYKPFAPKNPSLIDDFAQGASWTGLGLTLQMVNGDPLCEAPTCGKATAALGWNLVASKPFTPVPGEVYLASYDVKAGANGGAFNSNIMVNGSWASASKEFVQSTYFHPNEGRRVEHFFRATGSDPQTTVFLRPTDGTDAYAGKPMYFSRASLHPVKSLEALPLSTLAGTAVNTSATSQTFLCSTLGLGSSCPALVDEGNLPVTTSGGAVTVPARSVLQVYARSDKWSN